MKNDALKTTILSMKVISNVDESMVREFTLPQGHKSIGMFTADCDDVSYTALDEATKKADVKVVYAKIILWRGCKCQH